MRPMLMILMMVPLCAACAKKPVSQNALCDGTADARKEHARGLIEDGGPVSKKTGAALLGKISAGCG